MERFHVQKESRQEAEMASTSFVSVIIPVYNGEVFLAEAVESIRKQEHEPLEIIIVDDGSTDNTGKIARGLKGNIRYFYQHNSGPGAARNKGLEMTRGDIVGFLDADDLWQPGRLELQLARLAVNPSAEIVIGRKQRMLLARVSEGKYAFREYRGPVAALSLGCCLFRRSVFDKVGLFDQTLYHCDDWDWFMRAREIGVSMTTHPEVTLLCRRHEHNITNQVEVGNHYTVLMLKKSIDRRRQRSKRSASSLPRLFGPEAE